MHQLRLAAAAFAFLVLAACGPELSSDENLSDADALSQEVLSSWMSAKADGITVWIAPTIIASVVDGQTRWTLAGRTSRNLKDAFSWVPDDPFGTARVLSPRKFEVQLTTDELQTLSVGRQILIRLTPTTGSATYQVAVNAAPRFVSQQGASRINLHAEVEPVVMGRSIVYRGKASTTSAMAKFEVVADNAMPVVQQISARTWTFDWSHAQVGVIASGFSGAVRITATTATGDVHTRTASLALITTKLQVTIAAAIGNGDPEVAFPIPNCSASVKSCLSSLTDPNLDTSGCGTAVQVLACGGVSVQAVSASRFAADLRTALVEHYAKLGADIAQAGGASLQQAQDAVSEAGVTEVYERSEDPFSHDLSQVRVFRHADIVFPGSDNAWFGAYDRQTGALLEIYRFN